MIQHFMIHYITIILFAFSFLINLHTFAQKYKIKNDIILKDDVAIGKVSGQSGLLKANFQIYSMSGEKILSIQRDEFVSANPFYTPRYWYNIHFEDTGKDMMLPMSVEFSMKAVLNKTLTDAGIMIDGNPIKNQEGIIAKNDITDSIAKDTVDAVRTLAEMKTLIQSGTIQRNTSAGVNLFFVNGYTLGDTTIARWTIVQDQKVVGDIVRKIIKKPYAKDRIRYIIYKKNPGESAAEVPVAVVQEIIDYGPSDTPDGHIIKCITVMDNTTHTIDLGKEHTASLSIVPVNLMATYLIGKRYL